MIIDYSIIKKITFGAEEIIDINGVYEFYRFNHDELNAYKNNKDENIALKTTSASNIRFSFITNSETLKFKCKFSKSSSRKFAYFDLYENNNLKGHKGSEDYSDNFIDYEFSLSDGEKHIELYFPWSVGVNIKDIVLDDNSYIKPVNRNGNILFYGDSITQGYDAHYPSLSYSNQVSRFLNMDSVNKGIGGEIFFPELLDCASDNEYDKVFIAYGTNDWNSCEYDEFINNFKSFINKANKIYCNSSIYVISPIWRVDENNEVKMKIKNYEIHNIMENICKDYKNITLINGRDLTPHYFSFFEDEYLHPNDLGFSIYANNLYKILSKKV